MEARGDVDAPAVADAFHVKGFAEDADLAPGVPAGRDEDFVSVNDVVFDCMVLMCMGSLILENYSVGLAGRGGRRLAYPNRRWDRK